MSFRKTAITTGLVIAFLLGTVTGCAYKHGITTESNVAAKEELKSVKTYAWFDITGVLKDQDGKYVQPDYSVKDEMTRMVEDGLKEHGWFLNKENPDVNVGMALFIDMDAKDVLIDKSQGIGLIYNLPQGTLVINMSDPETGTVWFTGRAKAQLMDEFDVETKKKRVAYIISKMLKDLP